MAIHVSYNSTNIKLTDLVLPEYDYWNSNTFGIDRGTFYTYTDVHTALLF